MPRTAVEPRNLERKIFKNLAQKKGLMPEIRFRRIADINSSPETMQWHGALAEFGMLNSGMGNARSLGSIAITYVSANEMGRMISTKYPDLYENRRKTTQYMRRLSDEYRAFVRNCGKEIIETSFGPMDFGLSDYRDEVTSDYVLNDKRLWNMGRFATNNFAFVGKDKFAFDLNYDEVLREEFEKTIDFIKSHNLNIELIDRNRALHATILDMNQNIELREPKAPEEWPASMVFAAPSARVVI